MKRGIGAVLTLMVLFCPAAFAGQPLRLMLDWFPNVDHVPIYIAKERGYFDAAGITVTVLSPSDTADALKLAAVGQVEIAVSYQPQAVIAAARGIDIVVVGRLVEHPLTTLLYLRSSGIRTPTDLIGKRIGYTVPGLMDVLLKAFAALNGIDRYTPVNVGFSIVQALTSRRVDAVMGPFKTYETIALAQRGYPADYFELERWGIPDYDELIFVAGRATVEKYSRHLAAFSAIVQRSIDAARENPKRALNDYFTAVAEADRTMETEAFERTLPYFAHRQDHDTGRWRKFADFAHRYGLIDRPVEIGRLLGATGSPDSSN
jgi:putative hydroxymethylpyrimidine transport system substrate-binding protein